MLNKIKYCTINEKLDVQSRLANLKTWQRQYEQGVEELKSEQRRYDVSTTFGQNCAARITGVIARMVLDKVREPLSIIEPSEWNDIDVASIDKSMRLQYTRLSSEERLLWLNNFSFVMTPGLHKANSKLQTLIDEKDPRQRRGMLLFGESGMGKTSYLDFLWCQFRPFVAIDHNIVPFIKADAPASNAAMTALPQRLALEFGNCITKSDGEETLNRKLQAYTQICETVVCAIDEAEGIQTERMRRKIIELWNFFPNVVMVAASVNIQLFVANNSQIQKRFNVPHELKESNTKELKGLLSYLELMIPLPKLSGLFKKENLIYDKTKGNLSLVIKIISRACEIAIKRNEPALTDELLTEAWNKHIQAEPDRWNGNKAP